MTTPDDNTLHDLVRRLNDIAKCVSCRNHVPVEHIEAAITTIAVLRDRIAALEAENARLRGADYPNGCTQEGMQGMSAVLEAERDDLQERARLVDASISCAAMGHYKRGEPMHDDYKTVGLNDVLDLRDKWLAAEERIAALEAEISARSDLMQGYLDCWRNDKDRAERAEAERDALLRVVAAADAMHEAWYDGKDGEVARLMRDYDAPRAALKEQTP